jgi:uncharacterized protein (TIGR02588 family)
MKLKIPFRILVALIVCIVLVGVAYIVYNQFFNRNEKNVLQIVSIDLTRSTGETNFTVTVTIKNTGSNDITDAELNIIFIKDNDIVDSEKQPLDLVTGLQRAFTTTFTNVLFEPDSTYKTIATIYLDNLLLDTKTITKQF